MGYSFDIKSNQQKTRDFSTFLCDPTVIEHISQPYAYFDYENGNSLRLFAPLR